MFHTNTDLRLQELCANNQEFAELMKQRDEEVKFLLSRITHEIRNPLTLMYSTLQLIESRHPSVQQISYWPTLTEDMKDLFSLLDCLSDFTHCDTLHISELDLLSLLTDLKISFEPLANEKNAMLSIVISEQIHPFLHTYPGDGVKLKQVYTNLIKNAIEATTTNGSIQIKLSKEELGGSLSPLDETKKSFLCIAITNTGSTIAKEDLDAIFIPFVTTKATGSGLGLPTSKGIILSHGGYITAESTENTTTFSTYLPL